MRTALILLGLTAISAFAAIQILEIGPASSKPGGRRARAARHTISGNLRGKVASAAARLPARGLYATRIFVHGAASESPAFSPPVDSKFRASTKLVLVIIAYGAGMAIVSLLVLRWIAAFLQQAST